MVSAWEFARRTQASRQRGCLGSCPASLPSSTTCRGHWDVRACQISRCDLEFKNYYSVLGVPRNADAQALKSAYRKLARTYHPDVNPDDKANAERRFKEINEAYAVLSDPEKRRKYDRFGAEWDRYQQADARPRQYSRYGSGHQPRSSPSYAGQGSPRRSRYSSGRPMTAEEFAQIFETLFGGYGRSGAAGRSSGEFSDFFEALFGGAWARAAVHPQHGQDLETDLQVSLWEAFHGATRVLRRSDGRRIEVSVPRGVDTGTRVRIRGQGGLGRGGGEAGDLYLRINVASQAGMTRQGDNLLTTVPLDLHTAVRGGQVQVATLDGPLSIDIPAKTPNGRVFQLHGRGMPKLREPGLRGDLLVTVALQVPAHPTAEERRLLRELRRRERRRQPSDGEAINRAAAGIGLAATGVLALLWQALGFDSTLWLLMPALVLALWGLITRSGRLAGAGVVLVLISGLLLVGGTDGSLPEVLRWIWPLGLVAAGGYLALRQRTSSPGLLRGQ